MSIEKRCIGSLDGKALDIYTFTNTNGVKVEISNYGGTIVSILVPDRNGKMADVTLGGNTVEGITKQGSYFGVLVGRYANRIENSVFELNGETYHVAANDGKNHLHGGNCGFDKKFWDAEIKRGEGGEYLELTYLSVDGEENYPGNLTVKVLYTLSDDNALGIDYYAVSDKDTVINLTNHAYFNLAGHASGDILGHVMQINADSFTPVNEECIPTGEIRSVKGTPFDFTTPRPIGPGLESGEEQIACGQGYDHNWVLNVSGKQPEKAAEVVEPESGRVMEVYTTKPGIQFYSGNFLNCSGIYKDNASYTTRNGLCLETQYFPNSMKHRHFPSPILKAGEEYHHTTIYKFLVK